jgi:xanthine/uracil permease
MMNKLKEMLKTNWLTLIGVVIGAITGYLYWLKIGCSTGTCPITSSPVMSTIWGTLMGGLIFSIFQKKGEKQ